MEAWYKHLFDDDGSEVSRLLAEGPPVMDCSRKTLTDLFGTDKDNWPTAKECYEIAPIYFRLKEMVEKYEGHTKLV